jgi:hypothetical protein
MSKRPETWVKFRDTKLTVGTRWQQGLLTAPDNTYPGQPKVVPGAGVAREEIKDFSAEYWFALSKWAKERGLLQGWQRSLAFSLGKLAAQGRAPSDKQAVQGERIAEAANVLGFRIVE